MAEQLGTELPQVGRRGVGDVCQFRRGVATVDAADVNLLQAVVSIVGRKIVALTRGFFLA